MKASTSPARLHSRHPLGATYRYSSHEAITTMRSVSCQKPMPVARSIAPPRQRPRARFRRQVRCSYMLDQ